MKFIWVRKKDFVYSKDVLMKLRYVGVEEQKRKWEELYSGLGADARGEYDTFVASKIEWEKVDSWLRPDARGEYGSSVASQREGVINDNKVVSSGDAPDNIGSCIQRPAQSVTEEPDIAACPEHLMPSKKWEDIFLADFTKLRLDLSKYEGCASTISGKFESISLADNIWESMIEEYIDPYHTDGTLRPIMNMNPVARATMLRQGISYLETLRSLEITGCAWLFALCATIKSPIDKDTSASLRCLLRKCAALRAEKMCLDDEVIMLNILATISGKYFAIRSSGSEDDSNDDAEYELLKAGVAGFESEAAGMNRGFSASESVPNSCNTESSPLRSVSSAFRGSEDIAHAFVGVSTRGSSRGTTGLVNFRNICYMNSAIQCLVHTPEFADSFNKELIHCFRLPRSEAELTLAFDEMLRELWAPGKSVFDPNEFKTKLDISVDQFIGYDKQHDSQEFFEFLLQRLHNDLQRPFGKGSMIDDMFMGVFKSNLVCQSCGYKSVTDENFMHLSLPLQSTTTREMKNLGTGGTTEPLSLYSCLEAFLREETLKDNLDWHRCQEQTQTIKKLDLLMLPEVLVIQLQRFCSVTWGVMQKLETFVNFPLHDLDMTNFLSDECNSSSQVYELYAVTNHYGSLKEGHYTAYIKLIDENRWYNFNDSHVSLINEDDVESSDAYVLFYRRVRTEDAAACNGPPSSAGQNSSLRK